MAVLPDFDALGLEGRMMFEKAKPFNAQSGAQSGLRSGKERVASRPARRAGEALRALEWSELTARLNAARDLRLLLRTESHAPIEQTAASFGDAAASYFALLDDSEPGVNPDALGQPKALGAKVGSGEANRPGDATGSHSDAQSLAMREKCND
jgi:hypothetical protein